jgi:hypothetical protein
MVDTRAEQLARRVARHSLLYPGYKAAWNRFAHVLLSHGGEQVVPPTTPDRLIDVLRTHGWLWSSPILFVPGQPSACHRNAVALWRSGAAQAVGTGYALSDDGLWRKHSWACAEDGHLIETTEPRTAYFGVELRGRNADSFARWFDCGTPPSYRRTFGWSRLPAQSISWLARRLTERPQKPRAPGH